MGEGTLESPGRRAVIHTLYLLVLLRERRHQLPQRQHLTKHQAWPRDAITSAERVVWVNQQRTWQGMYAGHVLTCVSVSRTRPASKARWTSWMPSHSRGRDATMTPRAGTIV